MEAPAQDDTSGQSQGGLFQSLRALLATLLATVRTRGELLQAELEEERLRIAGIALFAVAAAFFLAMSVVVFSFFVILLFWDANRVLACGVLGLSYLLIGVIFALIARQRGRAKSTLFSASLAELAKDGEQLTRP